MRQTPWLAARRQVLAVGHGAALQAGDERIYRGMRVAVVAAELDVWQAAGPGLGVNPASRNGKQLGHLVGGEELPGGGPSR